MEMMGLVAIPWKTSHLVYQSNPSDNSCLPWTRGDGQASSLTPLNAQSLPPSLPIDTHTYQYCSSSVSSSIIDPSLSSIPSFLAWNLLTIVNHHPARHDHPTTTIKKEMHPSTSHVDLEGR